MSEPFKKKVLWGNLTILYCIVLYSVGHFSPLHAQLFDRVWIDHAVPFMPLTIVIYLSLYVFIIWTVLKLNWESTRQFLISAIIMQTVCFAFFIMYPITYPRQEFVKLLNPMAVSDLVVSIIWNHVDKPTNCFPSLHVAAAALCAIYLHKQNRLYWPWLLATAIFVSTLTMKQHYFWDIVGGLGLAWGSSMAARRIECAYLTRKSANAAIAAKN